MDSSTPSILPSHVWQRSLLRGQLLVGRGIEAVAALLLLIEVLLLGADIIARYVLNEPWVWADEIASLLFIWLGNLGAVIALQRSEHMHLSVLTRSVSPRTRQWLVCFSRVACLLFTLALIPPSWTHLLLEKDISTPALEISNAWHASALLISLTLMTGFGLVRLVTQTTWHWRVGTVVAIVLYLFLTTHTSITLSDWDPAYCFALFGTVGIVLLILGVPVAFVFGIATVSYLGFASDLPVDVMVGRMDEGMSHIILLSIPLFVFLGRLMESTGMARALVDLIAHFVGGLRGGLSYSLVGAMFLVSGISGSKVADMAAVAPALLPEMKKRGADEGEMVALLAATAAQTETIPPSLVLITIGSVTGVSIAALFTGGTLPALVLGVGLCLVIAYRHRKEARIERPTHSSRARLGIIAWALPALILPFLIRSAVVRGIATATEVSTIGIAYTLIAGLVVYRQFSWRSVKPMLIESASLSGAILFIIGAATAMAWTLTQAGIAGALTDWMTSLPGGRVGFLLVSILIFILLGAILEGIPAIVLFGPLLFPVATQLGVNEVHYAMVVILSMGIGLFSPPFGLGYYAACAIARTDPSKGLKSIWAYLSMLLLGILLVALVPSISTALL